MPGLFPLVTSVLACSLLPNPAAAARHRVLLWLLEFALLWALEHPQRVGLMDPLFTHNAMDWLVSERGKILPKGKGHFAYYTSTVVKVNTQSCSTEEEVGP